MVRHLQPLRARSARRRPRRAAPTVVVLATVAALAASVAVASPASYASPGAADGHGDLHHRQHRLTDQIGGKRADLDEISKQLRQASARVQMATRDLNAARTRLATANSEVQSATVQDQHMQSRLRLALDRLRSARGDLAQGRNAVARSHATLIGYAIANYQNGGPVAFSLQATFASQSTGAALTSLQDTNIVLTSQTVAMQRLQASGVLLALNERRVAATKEDVAAKRVGAAMTLIREQDLQRRAEAARHDVAARLATLRGAERQIAQAKRQVTQRLRTLQHDRVAVANQLRRIAERRARRHHAKMVAAAAATARATGNGYLSRPIPSSYVTSAYGMRMHPILHIWELHDGTDFAANCGTPVRAAASGRVTSEHFDTGYGNQLLVDHGFVKGVSLWTSYNHLTRFVAQVGQHVRRGQLIAFSGTTGYSTGCHLHFMVYVNGKTVDPMTWL